jgi:hypothetical protein
LDIKKFGKKIKDFGGQGPLFLPGHGHGWKKNAGRARLRGEKIKGMKEKADAGPAGRHRRGPSGNTSAQKGGDPAEIKEVAVV